MMQSFYRVRSGDTVDQIAKRWNIPIKTLIAANRLSPPYPLQPGQQLSMPPGVNRYRVQTGDSVYRLSQHFGVPVATIAQVNELEPPYILRVDQLLTIPMGDPYYVVQSGDTLADIANRYHVMTEGQPNPEKIQQVNHLASDKIIEGMHLTIPYAPIGDAGAIAYNSNRGGQFDIWLLDLRTEENQQLTMGLGDSFSKPVWSPDSSQIAFVGKDAILYVIYVTSGRLAGIDQLTEGGDFKLAWSPDNSRLAYSARGVIMLYNTTTHEAERIDEPGATNINWFPDGNELLFQALDASGVSQLYRYKLDGAEKRQITHNTLGPLHDVALSPDGLFVLYTSPGASVSLIYTIELASGNVMDIKGGPLAKNYYPTWSPDSSQIAFSSTAFQDRGYFSQLRTVGKQGGDERIWTISNCYSTPVTWSPDGKKIAYLSGCGEQQYANEIWAIDQSHPAPIQLLAGTNIMSLQWSPTAERESMKREYTNETFDVSFQYPAHWQKVRDDRYEGKDGFFQISALSGSEQIDSVCHAIAFQSTLPYGTNPQIEPAGNAYDEACIIYPSSDQRDEMKGQAAYIVKYQTPVTIDGKPYNYFLLWADKEHIHAITSTMLFLP